MPASGPTACVPKNAENAGGFAGRTGVCARNVRFWQQRRPGSHGRPDPGGLPVHECESGSFPYRHGWPACS